MPQAVRHHEVEFIAIRAQDPGGQNVNKVSNAVHLRFNIQASSLSQKVKDKLLSLSDRRVSQDGFIVIKAQSARSLEANKVEALERLEKLILEASYEQPIRRATKPSFGAKQRRLEGKSIRSKVKAARGRVSE